MIKKLPFITLISIFLILIIPKIRLSATTIITEPKDKFPFSVNKNNVYNSNSTTKPKEKPNKIPKKTSDKKLDQKLEEKLKETTGQKPEETIINQTNRKAVGKNNKISKEKTNKKTEKKSAEETIGKTGQKIDEKTDGELFEKFNDSNDKEDIVYLIKIEGEIDLGLSPFIKRVVEEADEQGIKAIIFEINTFGGRLESGVQIRDALLHSPTLTIAYINERAISAGALIALSCQKIVVSPGATIGAATPVTINPLDQHMEPASEKVVSYFRKEMKATAEKNGRPGVIAEAMVDPDIAIKGLTEKGKLLTLTSDEALQYKMADFKISHGGIDEVLKVFNLSHASVHEKNPNWAENFLRLISSALVSSLLLTIGLLALFMEFRTPTWGIAGTVGIICLALFFWGHIILNLVGWEEVILLTVGMGLLLLEIFVIPGFGLAGILGLLALAAGFTLSMLGNYPTKGEILNSVSSISIALVITIIIFSIFIKSMAKTPAIEKFVLHKKAGDLKDHGSAGKPRDKIDGKIGKTSLQPRINENETHLEAKYTDFLGQTGVAFTTLRPAGKGIFGLKSLHVITEGEFIEKGSSIRIIRADGLNLIVRKIKEEEKEREKA